LGWFISLSAFELASFDIVANRFLEQFSYLAPPTSTVTDLVNEKMKSDENFHDFANRWVTMLNNSGIRIPESQAIPMIVNNATPQLRSILMISEIHNIHQLHRRAKIIEAQIR